MFEFCDEGVKNGEMAGKMRIQGRILKPHVMRLTENWGYP